MYESREQDSIYARELYSRAQALRRSGLHTQALDSLRPCLVLRKKLYGEAHYRLGYVYSEMGLAYKNLGQLDLALENYNLAEQNYLLREDPWRNDPKVTVYVNIGNVYLGKLDYANSLAYFQRALELDISNGEMDPEELALHYYRIANNYYMVNDLEEAKNVLLTHVDDAHVYDKIAFYELLAYTNQLQGNIPEAMDSYKKSIEMLMLYEDSPDYKSLSILNYASFLISINRFDEAEAKIEEAHMLLEEAGIKSGFFLSYYHIIKGMLKRNIPIEAHDPVFFAEKKKTNLKEAIEIYNEGLNALNFQTPYDYAIVDSSAQWVSLVDCIGILKDIGDTYRQIANLENSNERASSLDQAIKNYKISGLLIQKARKEISNDESKIKLTELEYSSFQELVKTAYDAYLETGKEIYINDAFQATEKTKSSSVYDKLSNEFALNNSLIPDSLIQLEKNTNNTISIFSEKLYEEESEDMPDSTLVSEYKGVIYKASQQREALNQLFENEYPDYYELKYANSMLALTDIQAQLKNNELIVEYVFNETDSVSELYTFLISSNKLSFDKQELDTTFSRSIETTFHFMSTPEYMFTTNKDSRDFCVASHNLYGKLIMPFYDQLKNKSLIIVPDGKLSYIAFDALLQSLPDTSKNIQFNKLDYLIKEFNIGYTNSTNLLFSLQSQPGKMNNKVVAFAPEYKDDSIRIANQNYILFPLPGVQKEVDMIAETVDTDVFKGEDATETNFRKYFKDYDILHLAMHAFINDSLPSFSRLAFTQMDDTEDLLSDGSINTTDIYNLDLNAQLTVLSACNTGQGELRKGEGLMSLARGFFYAGCPSIVMSLWEVEDQSGTQIMSNFYKNLKKGKSKDNALRLAKLEYLENSNSRRAHPHYWLGYINLGNKAPLYKSYDFYFFGLLIILLIGIFADQLYKMKKARKKRAF